MNNLLKLEFRRLFRAKSFYICLAITFPMIVLAAFTFKFLLLMDVPAEEVEAMKDMLGSEFNSLSVLKSVISYASLPTILAIFVTIFVTDEYANDIIKNVYSKGYSRERIFFSKYLSSLAATLLFFLADAIAAMIVGKVLFGAFGTMGKNYIPALLASLFLLFAYHSLFFLIGISIRKSGGAIALSIIGPKIITLVLGLIDAIKDSEENTFSSYWLEGRLSVLSATDVTGKDILIAFLIGGIVIAACIVGGYFLNKARER